MTNTWQGDKLCMGQTIYLLEKSMSTDTSMERLAQQVNIVLFLLLCRQLLNSYIIFLKIGSLYFRDSLEIGDPQFL